MIPNLLDLILEGVYTQTDSLRYFRLFKEASVQKLFGSLQDPQSTPRSSEPIDLSDEEKAWLDKMITSTKSSINTKNITQVFSDLEKEIKEVEVLTVFIPFEMPRDEVKRLGMYLRQTYGSKFLMELKYDPKLIAGCAFSWKGIYKDYSLHQRMLDNQNQILQTIKKYIKHG